MKYFYEGVLGMDKKQDDSGGEFLKEDDTMAVLAKPCNNSFDLDNSKAVEFFNTSKNKNATKAIERFMAHKPKEGVSAPFKK